MSYSVYPPQQPIVILERVSPRYDASPTLAYRGWRILYPRSEIRLYSTSADAAIFTEEDDILANATETILYEGFDSAAVKDRNDDTYANAVNNVAAGEERDLVKWDLGSVVTAYIVAKLYRDYDGARPRILVSTDDVSYSIVCEVVGAETRWFAVMSTFRYLKLQVYNPSTSTYYADDSRFYTVEVYPVNRKRNIVRNTSPNIVTKLINIITAGYSSVLEVIWL
jgi:hypothetical protein